MIRWIYGNTLPLAAKLRMTTKTEHGEVTEDYFPPEGSVILPAIVGKYTRKTYSNYTIDGNIVTFTDDGTLGVGTYGIEIRVKEPNKNLRSFKCGSLTILNCSEDIDIGEFISEGAVVIDAMPYYWAKGDPFTYDDFTPEQIEDLKRPATEAAVSLTQEVHALEDELTQSEQVRVANESQRIENEGARQEQSLRDHNQAIQDHEQELQREQSENVRQENERSREQAEAYREETFATYRPMIDAKLDTISQEQFNQIFE